MIALRGRGVLCAALALGTLVILRPASALIEPRTLWEWRGAEGMQDWLPNSEITEVAAAGDALSFRTVGSDPIMVYRRPLDIGASVWQAIEVRMMADRSGMLEVFWSETHEGPYGGFSQEKVTRIGVQGDGAWHTYRAFPFWQKAGKITQLRFDPYDGTRFAIAFLRIVEWASPTAGGATLHARKLANALVPLDGVAAKASTGGLTLAQESGYGFALASMPGIEAEASPCVSVRLTSSSAHQAFLVFASDAAFGPQELPFSLITDGKPHTYNLDALSHPSWKGRIVGVGLRPGSRAGERVAIHSLAVTDRPTGPAEVRVQSFDAEDALPRTGRPFRLVARLCNSGGATARNVAVSFVLPRGGRVVGANRYGRVVVPAVSFGQEQEVGCRVAFSRPGSFTIGLRARAGSASTASSCRIAVTAPPKVAAAAAPPAPSPVHGKIDVGVYYFPGWRGPGQWAPIARFPERRPILGWYREGDPGVADWHIRWAVEHGITFFAYDWYWSDGARSLEHALHDGLFHARFRGDLKFCLLWANHNAPGTSSHRDFLTVAQYWLEHYFRRAEYYTIEGKPVVIIFTPHRFREDMGSEAVRRAFEAMRDECRRAGLPGLYMVACVGGDLREVRAAASEGYDAITAYNWPGLGVRGDERRAPFADLIAPYREHWERLAGDGALPLMTPISGGWDSRPWHGDSALARTGRTPELFRRHLADARQFIESNAGRALPVALIEAWNEFGEGSYIEPHREFGFGYLDAIRDVFTDAPRDHVDLTPADLGRKTAQVDVAAATRGDWDFSKGAAGWDAGMNLSDHSVVSGALQARTTSADPAFFGPPMQVAAARHATLTIRMRLAAEGGPAFEDTGQVFWTTRSSSTSEEASARFAVHGDGNWHEYRIPLRPNVRWRGVITGLRLDPCNRPGVVVSVSRISLW